MPSHALRDFKTSSTITRACLLMLGVFLSASWTGSAMSSSSPEKKLKSEGPKCPDGVACCGSSNKTLATGNAGTDLWVFGPPGTCTVKPGQIYMYRNVNIFNGGTLQFDDDGNPQTKTEFWAANMVVSLNWWKSYKASAAVERFYYQPTMQPPLIYYRS
jgi:hypothetical protein